MNLDDRMKSYENITRNTLMPRMPAIIRVDGKAFHTFTRGCDKPFDAKIADAMRHTAQALVDNIQNARMAYVQSDEISILLVDYNKLTSQQWFSGNINKMVSISAAIATLNFSNYYQKDALFDSRVFVLPENEVTNYFVWRQQDATRNAISGAAQALYSPKQLHGVDTNKMQEMIFQKGINFNDYETKYKRGLVITRETVDTEIPIFTQDRQYIEKFLEIEQSREKKDTQNV